jgi:hypothetical protein
MLNSLGTDERDCSVAAMFKSCIPAHCDGMQLSGVVSPNLTVSCFTKLGCPFEYRVKNRLQVSRGCADDFENFGGGGKLLQRFVPLAGELCSHRF